MVDINMDCQCSDGRYQLLVSVVNIDGRSIGVRSIVPLGSSLHTSTIDIDDPYGRSNLAITSVAFQCSDGQYRLSVSMIDMEC